MLPSNISIIYDADQIIKLSQMWSHEVLSLVEEYICGIIIGLEVEYGQYWGYTNME
jgi:hypothetical protein